MKIQPVKRANNRKWNKVKPQFPRSKHKKTRPLKGNKRGLVQRLPSSFNELGLLEMPSGHAQSTYDEY